MMYTICFEKLKVFQPLLMEYFSPEELADLKTLVIKLHMQQRKINLTSQMSAKKRENADDGASMLIGECCVANDELASSCINQLPDEILLKIFSKLTFSDKFKSARVCKRWSHLVYDKNNWKSLSFVDWQSSKILSIIFTNSK